MENDIKQKFDEHTKILDKHTEEIDKIKETQTKLLVTQAEMSAKLSSIEVSQHDIKKSITESYNSQKELINKLIDNGNDSNKFTLQKYGDLFIKSLGVLGIIYASKEIIMK